MKKFTIVLYLFLMSNFLGAQNNCSESTAIHLTTANNIHATINNWGYPFYDNGNGESFISTVNNQNAASSIYLSGLWLAGIDPGGNLKMAVTSYETSSFVAGPIPENLSPDSSSCANWDKIWVVSKSEIENHLADFADNGTIDNPIAVIFGWPANGNGNFTSFEGFPLPENDPSLAPFFDTNGDGNYQPENGEFPLPQQVSENSIPQEITFSLFNDLSFNSIQPSFNPLGLQIGQTTYAYDCEANNPLNNTIFVSFQMTNKGLETIDSMYCGMFTDFDLGCYEDDFMGSDSSRNTFFAYNSDNIDGSANGDCAFGIPSFGENPPVQAIKFLNQPLSNFGYYNNGGQLTNPGTQDPVAAIEYYRYLTGSWRDGSPIEFGGDGYQENTFPTTHAFPDDPNNPNGWSMQTANLDDLDRRTIGSSNIGSLSPGQSFSFDMAYTFVREEGADYLENVTAMYDQIDEVQVAYNNGFVENCQPTAVTNFSINNHNYKIFPNPTTGILSIQFPDLTLQTLRLIDVTGKVILEKRGTFTEEITLNFSPFAKGIYFLQMENATQRFYEKISVQ